MKTLKCDLCDHEAQGETFEEWMQALHPHYVKAHAEVMKEGTEEKRAQWIADNKLRFDAA